MDQGIAFQLPHPSYGGFTWLLRDEHAPASVAPLFSGWIDPRASEVPDSITVNGYLYRRADVPDRNASTRGIAAPISFEHMPRWRPEWGTQIQKLVFGLQRFDPTTVQPGAWRDVIAEQDVEYGRVFSGVHHSAVLPAVLAVQRFMAAHAALFGPSRREDATAMLQGIRNKSIDRAQDLWVLGRFLREQPELQAALDRKAVIPGEEVPGALDFRMGWNAFMDGYGWTTDNGQLDLPNWEEGSPVPLMMVRALARQDVSANPREAVRRQTLRRQVLEGELRAIAETDPRAAELLVLLPMAQQITPNLEDHNLLSDQRLLSGSRKRWLKVGQFLAKQALLARASDVFFMHRLEVFTALESGAGVAQEELDRRRRAQELYRQMAPPQFLGRAPEEDLPELVMDEATQGRSLRGVAAAAGSYRGRARVIESLEGAGKLEAGDVLVVRATTPPWTPYFGVIGALVANTGGALSHGSVVAREYGIPAVVGTRNGTSLIPDGAMVVVDGTTGHVWVE